MCVWGGNCHKASSFKLHIASVYKAVQTTGVYLSEPKSECLSAACSSIDSEKSDQLLVCLLKHPRVVILKGLVHALFAIALDMLEIILDAPA